MSSFDGITIVPFRLLPALARYRRLGFQERPCPPGFGYATTDVYMELELRPPETLA